MIRPTFLDPILVKFPSRVRRFTSPVFGEVTKRFQRSRSSPCVDRLPVRPFTFGKSCKHRLLFIVAACSLLLACSKSVIPNTDVEDNAVNKRILAFCETYRHAVEGKSVGRLLQMASADYHEDGGSLNGQHDLDYAGLKNYLTDMFLKTQAIRYEIRYRRITFTETRHIYVDYTYTGSYKIPGLKGEEWKHTVADNRLDLVMDGENFKIIAGM